MRQYLLLMLLVLSIQLFAQQTTEQLTATIIGSGSPKFNTERSGPSALISYKNTHILVDMGNGTQANLNKNNTKIKDIDGILFTHHHLDHNEEFTPIFIQSLLGGNTFTVAGPAPTTTLIDHILDTYEEDISYRLSKSGRSLNGVKNNFSAKNLRVNESFYIGDIKITCTEVNHAITTYAYRFDVGNQSIVISGDLTYSKSLSILAKDADYLIIDSGGAIALGSKKKPSRTNSNARTNKRTGNKEKAHVNLEESSLMAKEAHVKNVVLTHFNFTEIDEEATTSEIRKNYSGPVIYGKDLLTVPLTISTASTKNLNYTYPIVDTDLNTYYSDADKISRPEVGDAFYGQDAHYNGNPPSYTDNQDGTITDHVTGLTWEKDMGSKMTYTDAFKKAAHSTLGGHSDWRVPTIKELYSLILFTGQVKGEHAIEMFINTEYFLQPIGDSTKGEREIDAQTWSSTEYVGRTMKNNETVFGVNFVDGRIKGYSKINPRTRTDNTMYFRMVRGHSAYGHNNFIDNKDGTVSDLATGLMWQKADGGNGRDWEDALRYAEQLELGTHSDWRLPNAKELQSIVDYSRSPQTTQSPAIHPIFETTEITDPYGKSGQYPYFWSSTTHLEGKNPSANAVYISFGEAQGEMRGTLMDVHGAGAQRSDPKSGDKGKFPQYFGPQGDVRYVYNYVRAVRDIHPSSANQTEQQSNSQDNSTIRPAKQANANPGANTPPSFTSMLEKMDSNKDNKLSKSEVKGKLKENFENRDLNKDGFLTAVEMTQRKR
ncbi:Lcl domain-containing protein [Formosa sp. 3Alg 14/1]|uniref:Lcl domain-containing protein n=1 Tax=Formosa sp. 3Alg 14/1 TaxID=3382190 RepID=UPI0039BEAD1F